ncbi:nucleoid occlusion protein [Mammaliicoccus lentus]|uniref:nucleoid occlusion protein n=1 Tax=Mammaliicoccus lentus TaxID=42858 RepID=UPI00264A06B1|nr:nucleoid occlusion protein [Mammaliicoccus lentus]
MKKPFSKLFGLKDKELEHIEEARNEGNVAIISTEKIVPNRYQPRKVFDESKIKELAQSIKEHGLLQPIVVRPIEEGMYEIIAGERRFRAIKHNDLPETEAIIKPLNDKETAAVALIENIQRENLSAIEEAEAYRKLLDLEGITQQDLAVSMGKSQSFIANKLRLLKLSEPIVISLQKGEITERHARALLGLEDEEQQDVLTAIQSQNLNVKQTEDRVKKIRGSEKIKAKQFQFEQDITEAIDALGQSIKNVEKEGIKVKRIDEEHKDFYEITIKVYKRNS